MELALLTLAVVALAVLYTVYYVFVVVQAPRVVYHVESEVQTEVVAHLKDTLTAPYKPTPWSFYTHLMTPINVLLRHSADVSFERQLLRSADGGTISLDWAQDELPEHSAVCIVLTGLTGGSQELEIGLLVRVLIDAGYRCVVKNFRGNAGTPLTTPRFGECPPEDLELVVEEVVRRMKRRGDSTSPIFTLGYSAGANVVAHHAGVYKEKCRVDGVISVSNPFEVMLKRLYASLIYDRFFPPKRKAVVRAHSHLYVGKVKGFSMEAMEKAHGTAEFDDAVSRRAAGFDTLEEFYAHNSSRAHIPNIQTPTLFLHARDDPFIDPTAIPYQEVTANPNCMLVETAYGGHIAFMDGWYGLNSPTWGERLMVEYLDTISKRCKRVGVRREK